MSSVFISNFVTSDALQKAKLKPWYETVRGYLVFVNVLISAYMVYDVDPNNLLNCVSSNESAAFSAATTAYANSYCTVKLLKWHERNLGLVCLLCSVAIYLSFGWWLLIPSVKKSFLLIRQYDDQLQELKRGPSYLKSVIRKFYTDTLPNKAESDNAEASKLISATQQVWYNHLGSISIFTIYLIRNVISIGISASTVALLTCLATNDIENPMSCQLDVLNGARALCFVLAKDKLFPFIMTVISVTSLLGIFALMLFVWFGYKKYGDFVNKLICQTNLPKSDRNNARQMQHENRQPGEEDVEGARRSLLNDCLLPAMCCRPTSDRNNTGQIQLENRQAVGGDARQRLLNNASDSDGDDAWQKKLEKRTSDRRKAWNFAGLDPLDLERIEHGEDCNRFVKLFSQHAEPISLNTRMLMYFYLVIEPEDILVCPERFALLSPDTKMENEKVFMANVKIDAERQNAGIFNKLKELHNDVKSGKEFGKFVETHKTTFSYKDRALNQLLDDKNDACGCKSLFNSVIRLDENGYSLMRHVFNNVKSTPEPTLDSRGSSLMRHALDDVMSKIYLAAHLVLASTDEAGQTSPSSVVRENAIRVSLSNHLQFEEAPEPNNKNYNRYIVKKMVDMGLKRRRHDITH